MSAMLRGRAASLTASTLVFASLLYLVSTTKITFAPFQAPREPAPITGQVLRPPAIPPPHHTEPPVRSPAASPQERPVVAEPTPLPTRLDPIAIVPLAPEIVAPTWIRRPTPAQLIDFFPEGPLARAQSGRVALDCVVSAEGKLDCVVAEETPAGVGFGRAALKAARLFKIAPMMSDGRPTPGGRIRVPIRFDAPGP